ncbi:MAG: A24 family peptidase [Gammaproteobacteria bacterium]|nr:A24 family peptidase [Gammaproteobacteria bacterium]
MNIVIFLSQNPFAYILTVFILGLLVGSFLNVVILRLPVMLKKQWHRDCQLFLAEHENRTLEETPVTEKKFNLILPRSHCPQCGHMIAAWENIPLISYLLLRGKCRKCSTPISIRYPLIELLSGLLSVYAALHFGFTTQAATTMLLGWALLSLSFIDYDHQYLPDNITLPFLWLGLILNLQGVYTDIESALIGAMAGYLILWSIYQLFKAATGKEGMGFGDFKLLAMFGAWLGWQMLPAIIFLSSITGAVIGLALIVLNKQDKNIPIPFGPYLAIAGWLALLYGQDINQAYLAWIAH